MWRTHRPKVSAFATAAGEAVHQADEGTHVDTLLRPLVSV